MMLVGSESEVHFNMRQAAESRKQCTAVFVLYCITSKYGYKLMAEVLSGGWISVQLALTDFCLHLPLLRVASSAQQISVLPEYVCFRLAAFLKSLHRLYSVSFQIFAFDFIIVLFPVFWSRLCCCVIVPGMLAFHVLNLPLFSIFWFSSPSQSVTTEAEYLFRIRIHDGHWVYDEAG